MTVEQLRAAHRAAPFRPFRIRMADGRMFRVPHRDFLLITGGGRTVVVSGVGEELSILDMLLCTELEFEDPAPAVGGETNGASG